MTRPRAVVFDLGGVLITFDYRIAVGRLLPQMKIQPDELWRLLEQTQLLHDYERGEITTSGFFVAVQTATGFSGSFAGFCDSFTSMFGQVPQMVALHAELRAKGVRTYVLSNTNEIAIEYFREKFPFFRQFDGYVLSYDPAVRALKPSARMYEKIEEISGLRGSELFYLDDIPQYVETAQKRGWQAIVHTSEQSSREALIKAGLLAQDCVCG